MTRPKKTPTAPVVSDEKAMVRSERRWARLMELLGTTAEHRLPLAMPKLLPGVLPPSLPTKDSGLTLAMDAGIEEEPRLALDMEPPAAWGSFGGNFLGPGLAFLGFPYLAQLNQITEYRTPSEALSTELTRTWGKVHNKGKSKKDDKIAELTERLEVLKVRERVREASLKTEQFGRSHIAINIKGQRTDVARQLPLTKIEKGSLESFSTIEPYWLTPYSWNSTDPTRPDFYKPQSWFVLGKKTHASRLCTVIFREVPDLLKPAYDFAGISMTQLMLPYVQRWLRTAKNVNDLINIFSIVTLATDMHSSLQDPTEFVKRLQVFNQTRDNRGMMVINQGTEALTTQNVPLGTLDKLQAQAQEHMATPARMPLIKFFGITPTGLNASSEGEFRAWNDYANGIQTLGLSPHMERIIQIVQMDLWGEVDPDLVWQWLPLIEPTGKELADQRKADADRDAVYVQANVVSPEEIRGKLQNDPESGYDNLTGPAPEPPEIVEHNLNEESADNAAQRQQQLDKNKDKGPPSK